VSLTLLMVRGMKKGERYEYGIVPVKDMDTPILEMYSSTTRPTTTWSPKAGHHRNMPFLALTYTSRIIFTATLLGIIALLAYYSQPLDDDFQHFMDSQAFAVKFLFASLGTVISIFWRSFFQGVAAVGSYARMARRPRLAAQSSLRSPPTNSLSGAVTAV